MIKVPLTLSEAREKGLVKKFAAQEEARGVGPVASKKFDRLAAALITAPQPEGRTSRSRDDDGST